MKEKQPKEEKKKKKEKQPPKIEIEFIGQEELEREREAQKERKKQGKYKKREDNGKTKKASNVLEFTIQNLQKKKKEKKVEEKKPETIKEKLAKLVQKLKNKKKWLIIVAILFLFSILTAILYFTYEPFQGMMDEYIFRKNKQSEDLIAIPLDTSKTPKVIAYDNSLAILEENQLKRYNSVGNLEEEISIKVNDPIYRANGRFLAIGEKSSSKMYLLERNHIAWENDIEGEIARVTVNKNGYVAIVITGTSYKSIVAVLNEKGKELFKIYLATTSVADIDLSDDNKYLGIAEIDTSGTQIQSIIKMIEIEKAQNSPKDSIVLTHKAEAGMLLIDISFQSRGKLLCLYDEAIHITTVNGDTELLKLEDGEGKANFAEIGLNNSVYRVLEKSSGLFKANTILEIVNTNSKKKTIHTIDGIAKSTSSYGNMIILNMGLEVEFLNESGWIVKRYSSSRAMKDIVMNGNIAGIVYRDQVEIINL